jgi:hypothetical protein
MTTKMGRDRRPSGLPRRLLRLVPLLLAATSTEDVMGNAFLLTFRREGMLQLARQVNAEWPATEWSRQ